MGIQESMGEELKSLDEAMALLLVTPTTQNALSLARSIKTIELKSAKEWKKESQAAGHLYSDVLNLHRAILMFEIDPEMVSQNAMARLLSGLTPALLSLEEYLSGEDVDLWELFIDGSAVVTHLYATTPYITSAKLTGDFHFQDELVKVEDRLRDLLLANGMDMTESISTAAKICDDLRKKSLNYMEKPGQLLLLWYSIVIISYKHFKDGIEAR
ncbi:MAG: hypothetical protein JSW28_02575 [Thermoplasmata archaeon]|nr:MAG: hypothetical protein JSW28_02575 [Thermoplasmata archaeon]